MEKEKVPQENNRTLGGERKAVYALSEDGRYTMVASSGSKVEETVTSQALEEFTRLRDACRERVEAGIASTLEFHMYDRRMDLETLAQSVGMFRWRVRHHLKPQVFSTLRQGLLTRYAEALGIAVEVLTTLPPKEG